MLYDCIITGLLLAAPAIRTLLPYPEELFQNVYNQLEDVKAGQSVVKFRIYGATGKPVVVKFFKREHADRGLLEADMLHKLRNVRNVVRFVGVFKVQKTGEIVLVTEYAGSTTLKQRIDAGVPVDEEWACRTAGALLAVVHNLRLAGIMHRDLKPANVVIDDRSQEIVLIDFGLAIYLAPDEMAKNVSAGVGTASFFSPETLFDGIQTYESDYWAIGVVLVAMFLGDSRGPFWPKQRHKNQRRFLLDVIKSIEKKDAVISAISRIPKDARDLIDKLLLVQPYEKRCTPAEALDHPWFWRHNCDMRSRLAVPAVPQPIATTTVTAEAPPLTPVQERVQAFAKSQVARRRQTFRAIADVARLSNALAAVSASAASAVPDAEVGGTSPTPSSPSQRPQRSASRRLSRRQSTRPHTKQ